VSIRVCISLGVWSDVFFDWFYNWLRN